MSIPFGCDCGKRLQAKDEFAGKRMKCPGCGKILTIPGEPPAPPDAPEPPSQADSDHSSPPPASAAPAPSPSPQEQEETFQTLVAPRLDSLGVVRFVCNCGRQLTARLEDAGEETICPTCRRALTIPNQDTDEPPPERRRVDPYADLALGQTVTPWASAEDRRRRAERPGQRDQQAGSWLGTLLVLVLVGGALAALCVFGREITAAAHKVTPAVKEREHEPTELTRIPAGALAFVTIQPAAILGRQREAPAAADRGLLADLALQATIRDSAKPKRVVLPASAVERLTVVMLAPGNLKENQPRPERWLLFRTKDPYPRKALLKALLPNAKRRTAGDRHYYSDLKGNLAVYFATPHVFVVGNDSSIKRFLPREAAEVQTGPLAGAIQAAREGHHLVIGFNQTQFDVRPSAPLLPAAVLPFKSGQVVVDEPGPMRLELLLNYAQDKAARAAVAAESTQLGSMVGKLRKAQQAIGTTLPRQVGQPVTAAVLAAPGHPLMALWHLAALPQGLGLAEQAQALKRGADFLQAQQPTQEGSTLKLVFEAPAADTGLAALTWQPFSRLAFEGVVLRPSAAAPKR